MFSGFNIAFFPMHFTGLSGMPRRVYTYADSQGWGPLNMVSTVGAYLIAAGVLVFLWDMGRHFRPSSKRNAGNVWQAGTLEWLPSANYGLRSIPLVATREPLWDQPGIEDDVAAGRYFLPNAPAAARSTLVTNALDARPEYVLMLPGPGWSPLLAALGTAGFFLLLTFKALVPAAACGILAIAALWRWLWDADNARDMAPINIGAGIQLPTRCSGSASHAWWAMMMLIIVCVSIFAALVFAYLFLWMTSTDIWPALEALIHPAWPGFVASLLLLASILGICATRALKRKRVGVLRGCLLAGVALLLTASGLDIHTHWQQGMRPQASAYTAVVFAIAGLQSLFTIVVGIMSVFTVARSMAGRLSIERRACLDSTLMMWQYTVAQGLVGLTILHAFPRLAAG